jgi:ribosome-associated translation inhibitor RaiA
MVHISIRHRNVQIDDIVKAAANEKITRLARFLPVMDHAEVGFSEEPNPRVGQAAATSFGPGPPLPPSRPPSIL